MPLYAYVCTSCDRAQSHIRPIDERDAPHPCEACGAEDLERQITAPSVRFERSVGWDGWDRMGPGTVGRVVDKQKHIADPVSERNPGSRKS